MAHINIIISNMGGHGSFIKINKIQMYVFISKIQSLFKIDAEDMWSRDF